MTRHSGHKRCRRLRWAFSLVEMIVVVVVGSLALLGIWAFYASGSRQTVSTNRRLHGIQGVYALVERLGDDLQRLYWNRKVINPEFALTIERKAGGDSSLSFCIFDVKRSKLAKGDVRLLKIRYDFDAAKGRVSRTGRGGTVFVLPHHYERVVFGSGSHDGVPESHPFPYLRAPPFSPLQAGLPGFPNILSYQITSVAAEVFARPVKERRPGDRVTLCGAVLLQSKAAKEKHRYWLWNWSSIPRF